MGHRFGDLIRQYLSRKHGLSQNKLALGINEDPATISRMCKGERLAGALARERVVRIIEQLYKEGVLIYVQEANALLEAAEMLPLKENRPKEASIIQNLIVQTEKETQPKYVPISTAQRVLNKKVPLKVVHLGIILVALVTLTVMFTSMRKTQLGQTTTLPTDCYHELIKCVGGGWCHTTPVAVGDFSSSGSDLHYQVFFVAEVDLGKSIEYFVYFEGKNDTDKWVGPDVINSERFNAERNQWQFRVNPEWAEKNPNWTDSSLWWLAYECHSEV